jgi:hypothetical protein
MMLEDPPVGPPFQEAADEHLASRHVMPAHVLGGLAVCSLIPHSPFPSQVSDGWDGMDAGRRLCFNDKRVRPDLGESLR